MMAVVILGVGLVALLVTLYVALRAVNGQRRKAEEAGYASLGDYLRAAPRTDREKRDAVDLALKGVVLCVCGLLFPPLLLVGVVPLFYGGRKIAYSSLGLGLLDDGDPSSA